MANKADVKAMMARFQAGGVSTDESSFTPPGRIKQPLNPILSFGPTIPTKKPVQETFSGGSINTPSKPSYLKNTESNKSDSEVNDPNVAKAPASRFASTQDDSNSNRKPFTVNKQQSTLKSPFLQSSEAKGPLQKPPPFNKPQLSPTLSDPKPTYPKPPINSKPSWVKEDSGGGLQPKPSSSIGKLMQQNEELAGAGLNTANKPSPPANLFKPPINFKTAQNTFNKESDNGQVADDKPSNGGARKPPLTATNSVPPPKPLASKKPSIKKPPKLFPQTSSITNDATSGPKKNPLPNSLALGPAPAKPNRPPKVDLESFKRGTVASDNGPGSFKKPTLPIPSHASIHSNNMTPPQPPQPAVPKLPPGHPGAMMQQGEFHEDPPPLPPSTGHPSQRAKEENVDHDDDDDEDDDMYEDLEERWEEAEQKQDKQIEKDEKEEKKRLEAEKKQKKEREKKEQDARKKYKLVGSLDVIHQGKACVDCKVSKTDLALKHGDCLDIIRVMGNPEGKWLGRLQDGSIGYVKTTSVEIDFNTLKKHKSEPAYDPEVYDDIDVMSSDNSGMKRPGVVLPPPPGDGEEIYDDIDPNLDVIPTDCRSSPKKPRSFLQMFDRNGRLSSTKEMPPPEQFNADGNSAIDEDIYDDVDSQSGPPVPPTISSLPPLKGRSKTLEMDQKKQKKFEKEEKEFRKKFKYEGEIQVLNQVTIAPTLTNKKWSGKELAVRAGEKLDVIVNAVDNKLICRNDEGKFGYVSTGHIFTDDGDIYDDIGDDCIYDND
ncbi:FYN-binding protein 1 isoform X1 [Gymnodraco acuticeps]|uniref:FYN-binding protein 1 isoform X1 n=1 Tax=Gymnodraco acuticeps TaxID=8218 RepID=A0A6P8SZZ7_GYMAC|nr:FYN-binding protein 1 isoform X1 [Gymnodraco acuticeps]